MAFKDIEGNPINVLEQMDVDEFFNTFMDRLETQLGIIIIILFIIIIYNIYYILYLLYLLYFIYILYLYLFIFIYIFNHNRRQQIDNQLVFRRRTFS
jgi:cellulose synthase/poly-beta-1,6-N-acetylglucosamine synthase-like glycosyltransferase